MQNHNPQVDGELAVVEEEDAFFVVDAHNREDWLACFEKSGDFPAREWAENMVRVYNRRRKLASAGPPTPPGQRPASYHPNQQEADDAVT